MNETYPPTRTMPTIWIRPTNDDGSGPMIQLSSQEENGKRFLVEVPLDVQSSDKIEER